MSKFFAFGKSTTKKTAADAVLLGGKGAGLVKMSGMGIPVPPGFTIPTTFCNDYMAELSPAAVAAFIDGLVPDVGEEMAALQDAMGYAPLVSVRSGAPVSMPGMMDTILNVGLTTGTLAFWKTKIGAKAALDSYRRLIQMLGATAYGVPSGTFDELLEAAKAIEFAKSDKDLSVKALTALIKKYKSAFQAVAQCEFPDTVEDQLKASIAAVFNSWTNERAVTYRKLNNIDKAMGTAVTVQVMVFGNLNDNSGSGVLFSRSPATGEDQMFGEFLANAQGEDVVAGIRTPLALADMAACWPKVLDQLCTLAAKLEEEYLDMVDMEFTVQDKKLYILQCRAGKRGATAAFVIARDLAKAGVISKKTAIKRLSSKEYKLTKQPVVDPNFKVAPHAVGLFGSAGVAVGVPVFSSAAAINCTVPCILVTKETDPDDIGGMNAAKGILTATGGQTSHAAVVARGMNKPCVVGCLGVVDAIVVAGIKKVTMDGATGNVWFDVDVPVVDNSENEAVAEIVSWIVKEAPVNEAVFTTMASAPKDKAVTVMVGDWEYGSPTTTDDLKKLYLHPDKSLVTLDFRVAQSDADAGDASLLSLYPNAGKSKTKKIGVTDWIAARAATLKGITLMGIPKSMGFDKVGFTVKYPTVEVLSEMLDGGEITIGPALATELGSESVEKITALLAAAGKPVVSPTFMGGVPAHPAEYQVFKALG